MKKKELLTEIMGVPKAIDFWVDVISVLTMDRIVNMINDGGLDEHEITVRSTKNAEDTNKLIGYVGQEDISGSEVMGYIYKALGVNKSDDFFESEVFKKMPLYKPTVALTCIFFPDDYWQSNFVSKDEFGNAAFGYNPNIVKISKIGKHPVFVGTEFTFSFHLPISWMEGEFNHREFLKLAAPIISHEFTHALEAYHRLKSKNDPFYGRESFLNIATNLMSDDKFPKWNYFLHLVYLHLSFESNARITQLYYGLKNKDINTYDDFIRELKKTSVWENIQQLLKFDAKQFLESFSVGDLNVMDMIADMHTQLARKERGLPVITTGSDTESTIKGLIEAWHLTLKYLNDNFNRLSGGLYSGKLMQDVPKKAKDDPYVFFKFFEDRFKNKAEKLKKKSLRLSSLVLDGKENIKESTEDYSWVDDYIEHKDPLEQVKEFIFNKLKDCKLIPSEKRPGWTKYIDKNGEILFADDIDTGTDFPYLYADYHKIWLKCKEMGCSWEGFKKICKDMLYEIHKRKVYTTLKTTFKNKSELY